VCRCISSALRDASSFSLFTADGGERASGSRAIGFRTSGVRGCSPSAAAAPAGVIAPEDAAAPSWLSAAAVGVRPEPPAAPGPGLLPPESSVPLPHWALLPLPAPPFAGPPLPEGAPRAANAGGLCLQAEEVLKTVLPAGAAAAASASSTAASGSGATFAVCKGDLPALTAAVVRCLLAELLVLGKWCRGPINLHPVSQNFIITSYLDS